MIDFDPSIVVDSLRLVLSGHKETIPLHEPKFSGHEWKYVKDCLDSTYVSSVGQYVGRFEEKIKEYTGVKHAIAVVNGTAALHICSAVHVLLCPF